MRFCIKAESVTEFADRLGIVKCFCRCRIQRFRYCIGRDAILAQQEKPLAKSLACFTLADSEVVLLGRETIYRNGERAGWLSSGGWGYTVNTNIGFGYLRNAEGVDHDYLACGTYELEVASARLPCELRLQALYDPKMLKLKC
ncbi:MAG: glycine cleavage T C-terminal barrel domain-containing protein [Gammaproteobacteria bacterium]